jgi:hypothetical protein
VTPTAAGLVVDTTVSLALGPSPALVAELEIPLMTEHGRFPPDEIKVKVGAPFALVTAHKGDAPEEFESQNLRRIDVERE